MRNAAYLGKKRIYNIVVILNKGFSIVIKSLLFLE